MRRFLGSSRSRLFAFSGVLALGWLVSAGASFQAQQAPISITVYKTATCGCCSNWVDHLRTHNFEVRAVDVEDIQTVKRTYGVPAELGSCHTAVVGGYVVEGHVPGTAVARMLKEKPAIVGIAVPGMPVGSPGMEVPGRSQPYDVVAFDKSGKREVYERH
ncbi:MAG: DUF411 domain-containing protein [Vicinamibacterales bacterium]